MRNGSVILAICLAAAAAAEIVDRVVAVVDSFPIKESDVRKEIRLAAFMNHEPAVYSLPKQTEAVNRLIDQVLIREEIDAGPPRTGSAESAPLLLQQLRASYGTEENFRRNLRSLGIAEDELRKQLEWQAAVLQFVEFRFGRIDAREQERANSTNEDFFAWLDATRKQRRIEIREDRLK